MRADTGDQAAIRQLAANDFFYRRLLREVDRLRARGDPKLLPFIEDVARFAWQAHPGRLADGALENPLLEIGRTLIDDPAPAMRIPDESAAPSRTLHVASAIYSAGGHSRLLAKWIQRDLSSTHAIILTRQDGPIPAFMTKIAQERGAPITMLDRSETILVRARQLRILSRDFDRIVLHQHPDDAVPVIAYAKPGGCPVAMFNHAHFWFSLGSGVADLVVNTTLFFKRLTEDQRHVRATDLLHGPPGLDRLSWTNIDKRQAKENLGIPSEVPVVMAIGHEAYFTPSANVDFFSTLEKLLISYPAVHVLIVGVSADSALLPASVRTTERVKFLGPVPNPRPYYEAADVCLESFPTPSLGALIEASAYGQAFPVPAYAKVESPAHINQIEIADIAVRQPTEPDYIRYVGELLDAPETTLEQAGVLRRRIIADDERFGDQFAALYQHIARFDHAPHEIPETKCITAPDNLVLASLAPRSGSRAALRSLPLPARIRAYAKTAARGHENAKTAFANVVRDLMRPLFRRLPNSVRRRLRIP